ncbi:hypothetical protein DdX_09631 [Ditylenchus destructor]|uniref:Uncharacterized protein n=1 Tax=Ditylenchus destructor TaxID=166010 RepID=A0AAD4R619_9BILA|nr:hypothetical protein DdX_09631 [Ditylenchus destructor]
MMIRLRVFVFSAINSLLCAYLFVLLLSDTSRTADGFVLQELPLYRSERHEPRAFAPDSGSLSFGREVRAYNFPRWNRLHSFWTRNEMLKRLSNTADLERPVLNNVVENNEVR